MPMDQVTISQDVELVQVRTVPHEGPRLFQVNSRHLLPQTYLIESASALEILLQPWIVGSRLAGLARTSSMDFLQSAYHICSQLRYSSLDMVTEVVPLAGALYYNIAEAFETLFGETINRCFIGAKRSLTPQGWITQLAYENFEAMTSEPLIVIGDTIATGGTIERIIESIMAHVREVKAIIIYSIAGGLIGAVRLRQLAERIDAPIYCFFSNAIFGVTDNGTDMPWLHPATIMSPNTRQLALDAYGPELGRRWCSVWDWGERAKQPTTHLERLQQRCMTEMERIHDPPTRSILQRILTATELAMQVRLSPVRPRV